MVLLRIIPENDTPIYKQVRDQIVAGVAAGELKLGDQLPSVREFSRDLGVNYHTVNKAYALLRDEGYVNIFGRKGVFISKPPEADEAFINSVEKQLEKIMAEAMSKGMTAEKVAKLAAEIAEKGKEK